LRPSEGASLTAFTVVADRGPFNVLTGKNQLFLSPPVDVKNGDLIAVTSLVNYFDCGSPEARPDPLSVFLEVPGDVQGGTFNLKGTVRRGQAVGLRATDTTEVREGVIAAVGSLPGNFGSFFRTSLQITSTGTSTGRIVFHPAGVPASPNDQALPYTVSGGAATYFADIVSTMGKSGLGTLDIISNDGLPPLVTARVYNDLGPSGTAGFTEDLIRPDQMLHTIDTAAILTPADLTNFRMNIGVRTFGSSIALVVSYGNRGSATLNFPANTFQQYSLAGFGDPSPVPNELITFTVIGGDAVVYASTTDNRTNDSSVRFATRE
jgi:hypothetical protein